MASRWAGVSSVASLGTEFRRRKSSTMARSLSVTTSGCDGGVSCNSPFSEIVNNWLDAVVSPCAAVSYIFSAIASKLLPYRSLPFSRIATRFFRMFSRSVLRLCAPFGRPLGLPEQPGLKRPWFGGRPQPPLAPSLVLIGSLLFCRRRRRPPCRCYWHSQRSHRWTSFPCWPRLLPCFHAGSLRRSHHRLS